MCEPTWFWGEKEIYRVVSCTPCEEECCIAGRKTGLHGLEGVQLLLWVPLWHSPRLDTLIETKQPDVPQMTWWWFLREHFRKQTSTKKLNKSKPNQIQRFFVFHLWRLLERFFFLLNPHACSRERAGMGVLDKNKTNKRRKNRLKYYFCWVNLLLCLSCVFLSHLSTYDFTSALGNVWPYPQRKTYFVCKSMLPIEWEYVIEG